LVKELATCRIRIVAEADALPARAVMVAAPLDTAVTRPVEPTVATDGADELQEMVAPS
jgi:hypothetical protein